MLAFPDTPSLVAVTDPEPAAVPVAVVDAALVPLLGDTETYEPDQLTERPVSSEPSAAYVRAVNDEGCPMPMVPAPLFVTTTVATGLGLIVTFTNPLFDVDGYCWYVAFRLAVPE